MPKISSPENPPEIPSKIDGFDAAIAAEDAKAEAAAATRIPPEAGGIQINFCKDPACPNFGIAEDVAVARWSRNQTGRYKLSSAGKHYPHLTCKACLASFPVKSNQGILEELGRMQAEISVPEPTEPCCPHEDCSNHGLGVSVGKPFYSSFGSTSGGSPRWKCMADGCGKTFSAPKSATLRQRDSHKNKMIFKLLVNKMPLRRICEVMEIGPSSLYGKIDFLHRQCMRFMADRESKLPELKIRRLYLGVDRQDYQVNWTQRDDRRNTVISAVSSIDNETAYCFGLHLNFDESLDATLQEKVARVYAKAAAKDDAETEDDPTIDEKLPDLGMQIHAEYTLYAHFMHLRKLTLGVEKLRFLLDQDLGMRAACLAAFAEDIKDLRRVDAFFVSIGKELTVDQRRSRKNDAKEALAEYMAEHPKLDQTEAVLGMIKLRLAEMAPIGKWSDR